MVSLYETNVLNQLKELKRILLHSNLPSAVYTINSDKRRVVFVGIGSSYWAARISEFLWREYINPNCIAYQYKVTTLLDRRITLLLMIYS